MRIFTINGIPGYPLSRGQGFGALAVKPDPLVPTARMRRRHDAVSAWRPVEVFTTAAVAVKPVDHPTGGLSRVPLSVTERSP